MHCLQMLCMHKQPGKFVFITFKSKKHSKPHIIYAAFHCPIHSLRMITIIMFWPCRMQLFIAFFIVSFLKKYISSNPCLCKFFIIFYSCSSNIYIHPSYGSIFMVNTVNSLNAFQNIFNRIMKRIFSRFYCKPFMPHILQGNYLFLYLFLSKLLSGYSLIFSMIRTVYTSVYTIVRQIKRCKHNYSIAVESKFNFLCYFIYFFYYFRNLTGQKNRSFSMCKAFTDIAPLLLYRTGFFQDIADQFKIIFVLLCIS